MPSFLESNLRNSSENTIHQNSSENPSKNQLFSPSFFHNDDGTTANFTSSNQLLGSKHHLPRNSEFNRVTRSQTRQKQTSENSSKNQQILQPFSENNDDDEENSEPPPPLIPRTHHYDDFSDSDDDEPSQNHQNQPSYDECLQKIFDGENPSISLHEHQTTIDLQNEFRDKCFGIKVNHCHYCEERWHDLKGS